MANVLFLRGTQATLPNGKAKTETGGTGIAQDGAFYLTTDSHRLYVGNSSGTADLLSQAIAVVDKTSDLGTDKAPAKEGQFVYVLDGNILAIYEEAHGTEAAGWRQINAQHDFYAQEAASSVSATSNVATISNVITVKNDKGELPSGLSEGVKSSFKMTASGDAEIGASDTDGVQIYAAQYDVSAASVTGGAKISLNKKKKGESASSETDYVEIDGGQDVTVSQADGKISVASTDQQNKISSVSVVKNNTSGFDISIATAYKDASQTEWTPDAAAITTTSTTKLDPHIALSTQTTAGTYDVDLTFKDNYVVLPVYSKAEIDAKEIALNAMEYRGVISDTNSDTKLVFPTTADLISIGDTYKIGATGTATVKETGESTATSHKFKQNDVVIANGTEFKTEDEVVEYNKTAETKLTPTNKYVGTINPDTLFWDYIPAGDVEANTRIYSGKAGSATNTAKFAINEKLGSVDTTVGELDITAGSKLALSDVDSSGTTQAFTISHATVTAPSAPSDTDKADVTALHNTGDTKTFKAVIGVTEDNYGHVTGLTTHSITVSDTVLSEATDALTTTTAVADKVATITNSVSVHDTASKYVTGTSSFKIASDTINMSVGTGDDANKLTMNLVWGSF